MFNYFISFERPQTAMLPREILRRTVGPGFDFQDFEMIPPGSAELAQIAALNATLAELV